MPGTPEYGPWDGKTTPQPGGYAAQGWMAKASNRQPAGVPTTSDTHMVASVGEENFPGARSLYGLGQAQPSPLRATPNNSDSQRHQTWLGNTPGSIGQRFDPGAHHVQDFDPGANRAFYGQTDDQPPSGRDEQPANGGPRGPSVSGYSVSSLGRGKLSPSAPNSVGARGKGQRQGHPIAPRERLLLRNGGRRSWFSRSIKRSSFHFRP